MALCIGILIILPLTGCGPAKQRIPVSTNPLGAAVYADGKKVCTSPCTVAFDRQGNHLVTIVKEGYEQVDLKVTRQFQPDRAIRDGLITGVLKGGDPKEVGSEVAREVDEQERSGEAYKLEPDVITVTLTPLGGRE
ncbi:PEGA domain-containing protein [Pseudodesulfovibrio cashew]|uniref:PEGA domain-containing protein n=2 Tax=Pseudodesulfovibrio cashew TaxID=2678688 RepID=A0A6I6JIE9_9BACT|nr:PEGA domain-containing protein [Pseudodesulfovibrio cashew]